MHHTEYVLGLLERKVWYMFVKMEVQILFVQFCCFYFIFVLYIHVEIYCKSVTET